MSPDFIRSFNSILSLLSLLLSLFLSKDFSSSFSAFSSFFASFSLFLSILILSFIFSWYSFSCCFFPFSILFPVPPPPPLFHILYFFGWIGKDQGLLLPIQ